MPGFRRRRTTPEQSNTPNPAASTTWFASAGLIGLVIVALIGVLIYILVKPDTPAPGAATPAPTASPAPGGPATAAPSPSGGDTDRPAGCHTSGTDQTVPTGTPAGVTWTLVAGVAVPTSPADGPALHGDAGVGYCYSHTPVGALLAAGRGIGSGDQVQRAALKYSTVPNEYSAQAETQPGTTNTESGGVQLAGFRILSYSPAESSIALAYAAAATPGQYAVLTALFRWDGGDWKVVLQPGPSAASTTTTTRSLNGYVAWSGVS